MPGLLSEGRVTANGLRFAYLDGGSGPLVVLLHGWPDTPHTWDHQMTALAGAGFRVVAPWLRGFPRTEVPRSGRRARRARRLPAAGLDEMVALKG